MLFYANPCLGNKIYLFLSHLFLFISYLNKYDIIREFEPEIHFGFEMDLKWICRQMFSVLKDF